MQQPPVNVKIILQLSISRTPKDLIKRRTLLRLIIQLKLSFQGCKVRLTLLKATLSNYQDNPIIKFVLKNNNQRKFLYIIIKQKNDTNCCNALTQGYKRLKFL